MTYLFDDKIRYDDSGNLDAFGNLRTSVPRVLSDYRFHYDEGAITLTENLTTGSGTVTNDFANTQILGSVTTASGDRALVQSKQYHPYISGTSNRCLMTFKMDTPKANVAQMVGLFDDDNGIFFRMNGLTPEMVVRKKGVDNEVVAKTSWNLDRLDGSMNEYNKSGITADFTKCQIFICDYQWLGVGRVRVGFVIDGQVIYVHQFLHANTTTEPYIMQPSLPVRWEITNTGTSASSTTMQFICAGVYVEGAEREIGFSRSVSTDGNVTTINNATDGQCVLAIKLKDTIGAKKNKTFARLKQWDIFASNDVNYKVIIAPNASSIFSNTPAWADIPGYGFTQYVKNPTLKAGWAANVKINVIADGFAAGTTGVGSGSSQITDSFSIADSIYQNYHSNNSQILAVIGYKLANNSDVKASLRWIEIR